MSEAKAKAAAKPEADEHEGENIDTVRDILFGAQMRTVDRRLAQIESRFQRDLETTKKDLTQKLDTVEAWAKKQVDSLDEKVKAERQKRTDELKALRTDMRNGLRDLDKALNKLDDATTRSDAEIRDSILQLSKSLSSDIDALSDRLTADIDRYVAELRFEKTDTASLVELFTDVAHRLGKSIENPEQG